MVHPDALAYVQGQPNIVTANPNLRHARGDEPNPDPRPLDGSHVGLVGASVTPPSIMHGYLDAECCQDGFFDTNALYHGAFAPAGENWLDEWTWFGAESRYQ